MTANDMMTLRALLEKSSDADLLREMIGFTAERLMAVEVECQSALKFDPLLEWAPGVGQFQAADLTGLRVCSSSKRLGLRYPSAECRRRSL